MAIDFNSGANSLFPRLGRIGKFVFGLNGAQAAELTTINDELGRYPAVDMHLVAALAAARDGLVRNVPAGALSAGQNLGAATLQYMVAADQPTRAGSPEDAMTELIRQMVLGGVTVKAATVAATAAAFAGVTGSQQIVVTPKRGDGLFQQNLIAEAAQVRCVTDSRSGGAPVGGESYLYVGVPAGSATGADYDWPLGSGAGTPVTSAWALTQGINRLANGGFDGTWASVTPPNWTKTGTIIQELATVYATGASSVKVAAGQTPTLTQAFGNGATGTAFQPQPYQSLAFCLFARALTTPPAAGVFRVELWSTGGVVNDATGSPARVDFTLASTLTVANTWYALTGVVRTPLILPAGLAFRVNVQTACDQAIYFDHCALCPLTPAYNGGPGLAVFGGDVQPLKGDGWTVTSTNDRGGATYGATFNTLFDRLFSVRNMANGVGLQMPTAGGPTISDTLITA